VDDILVLWVVCCLAICMHGEDIKKNEMNEDKGTL
jgi:hypothetical protein